MAGCRLTWAHSEDSNDIDGILCLDRRWKLHAYAPSEKLYPFVLEFASKTKVEGYELEKFTFAVSIEETQTAWVSNFVDAMTFAQSLTVQVVKNSISNELAPAKVRQSTTGCCFSRFVSSIAFHYFKLFVLPGSS